MVSGPGMAIEYIPAWKAASSPIVESSNAQHKFGGSFSAFAAFKYGEGSGFGFLTSSKVI